jgi:hypothetical protein
VRAIWLGVGSALTVLAVILSTVAFSSVFADAKLPTETTSRSIPIDTLAELRVEAGHHVNVRILPGEAGVIGIERFLQWSQDKPSASEDWDGRTLRLDATCSGGEMPTGPICYADYLLLVPQGTAVEAVGAAGSLAVNRMAGGVRLTTVSGWISASGIPGSLYVRSGSGRFRGDDLRGDADVEVVAGDVDLSFLVPPTQVRAVVKTSGDIRVILPNGGYDVTAQAPEVISMLESDPVSPRKIAASTPDGTVEIHN